jgi:hypothetical protein
MSSAESMKASDDALEGTSTPAGVRLWAKWAQNRGDHDAVLQLLSGTDKAAFPHQHHAHVRQTSAEYPVGQMKTPLSFPPYNDGTPPMLFLDGEDRVDEGIRAVLKAMVSSAAIDRPSADAVNSSWQRLRVRRT